MQTFQVFAQVKGELVGQRGFPWKKAKGRPVYVRAATLERAEIAGKELLRMFGQRGRFRAIGFPYNPLNDPEMRDYVRAI